MKDVLKRNVLMLLSKAESLRVIKSKSDKMSGMGSVVGGLLWIVTL